MKSNKKKRKQLFAGIIGSIVGLINGFFGGGGGMICVPFFEKFAKMETKNAHATTLCVILPISIVSSFVYLYNNDLNFLDLSIITIGAMVGGVIGAIFLKKLNSKVISIIFAVIMLVAGIKMVI